MVHKHEVSQGSLLATLPKLGRQWRVSTKDFLALSDLSLKVSLDYHTSAPAPASGNSSASVFRMSIGGDITNYGDQIALIRYWNNIFWILSPINGEVNWETPITSPPVNDWCSIEVVHQVEKGEYVYNVTINGVVEYSTKNSEPAEFSDVLVYASDPWHPAHPSRIRALTILTIMVLQHESFSYLHTFFVAGLEETRAQSVH